ncbi:MAG: two-component hybrid histidine kinase [Microvirga sp.]|nr:two-component hybrid histidine kinase [Microvirga sp.]
MTQLSPISGDPVRAESADDALRHRDALELLVQSVKDYAILILDTEGHVVSWNEGARRIKGYAAEEILGESFTRFYTAEAIAEKFPQFELKVASRDGRFEDEGWRVRKDGSRFWANVIITALKSPDGRLIGFGKVTRDLTERRKSEEQARRLAAEEAAHAEAAARSIELEHLNQRLREQALELQVALSATRAARDAAEQSAAEATAANRELDQFAYVASHDLKAPLRGIANLAQWIQDDLGERLTGDSLEHIRLLQGRVARMEALINGILAYSRAGRNLADPETIDVGGLLREVVELLQPPPGMAIHLPDQFPTMETERVPLQQVFMNLIGNAIKYTSGARADGIIRLDWKDAGDMLEFHVSDNGPGIAPAYHDKIWGIFQTLVSRDKVEGTGIGLSVVKKIVESRGGRVCVESAPNEGATFHFTWPVRARQGFPNDQ